MDKVPLAELRRQAISMSAGAFTAAHPHDWLVWDASVWQPAKQRADPTVRGGSQAPDGRHPLMCLSLALAPGQDHCLLGRSAQCDLSLNDSTLSSRHLAFTFDGATWRVADLRSSNGSTLDGSTLPPEVPMVLKNGAALVAGDVSLTFYTSAGLLELLAG
jgi:hypothetical protein